MQTLILASSSSARKRLLSMLALPFECISPNIDETPKVNEPPLALVQRLSLAKAKAVAQRLDITTEALIISGDQIAHHKGEIFGKPGNLVNAKKQLQRFSGQMIEFLSGLCVYNTLNQDYDVHVEPTQTYYHNLSESRIDWYLKQDKPIHCAGSIKLESFGLCLCKKISSDDPFALSGIPMLKLMSLLEKHGMTLDKA